MKISDRRIDQLIDRPIDFAVEKAKELAMEAADRVMSWIPHPRPQDEVLRRAKIIAHRGYCLSGSRENTLPAFRAAMASGVWGIEFDLRWTSDDVPLIFHDPTPLRVFSDPRPLASLNFATWRNALPEIPTFAELLEEFKGKIHLMIELKEILTARQAGIVRELLSGLEPIRDYHFISLKFGALKACAFLPPRALVPIAEFNASEMSRLAVANGMGGVAGQYLMLPRKAIEEQHRHGLKAGSGFISSRHVLYRELGRGVDWLFTNHAVEMMKIIKTG